MSKASQQAFLEKLHAELQASSRQYRRDHSDKQFHHFSMRVQDIENGLRDFLLKSYGDVEVSGGKEGEKVLFKTKLDGFIQTQRPALLTFVKSIRKKVNDLPADKVIKPKGWNKSPNGDFTVGFRHNEQTLSLIHI